jgi:CsoR family transcriptional regulator, copper-sensing transcriptional repressor
MWGEARLKVVCCFCEERAAAVYTIPPYGTVSADREDEMYGYALNKEELEARLVKIEGQVRGIRRMVDQDKYCIDILTQLNAVSAALKAVGVGLLDTHVRHCVRESIEQGEGDAKIEELVATVARFVGR